MLFNHHLSTVISAATHTTHTTPSPLPFPHPHSRYPPTVLFVSTSSSSLLSIDLITHPNPKKKIHGNAKSQPTIVCNVGDIYGLREGMESYTSSCLLSQRRWSGRKKGHGGWRVHDGQVLPLFHARGRKNSGFVGERYRVFGVRYVIVGVLGETHFMEVLVDGTKKKVI